MSMNVGHLRGDGGQIFGGTGRNSTVENTNLPQTSPKHTKMELKPPSWGEKLKAVGLVVGTVVCGALALGLLPLTIIGGVIFLRGRAIENDFDEESGKVLKTIGKVIAAPATGFMHCVRELQGPEKVIQSLVKFLSSINEEGHTTSNREYEVEDIKAYGVEAMKNLYNAILDGVDKGTIFQKNAELKLNWLKEEIQKEQRTVGG